MCNLHLTAKQSRPSSVSDNRDAILPLQVIPFPFTTVSVSHSPRDESRRIAEHPLTFPERRCTSITRKRSFLSPCAPRERRTTRHPNVMRLHLDVTSDALESECRLSRARPRQTSILVFVVGKEGQEEKALRKPRKSTGGANEGAVMEDVCEPGREVVRADG